ncbi:MAG: ABC transporter substrate-binding protein [Acidimicrobiales bacterium]
MPESTATKLLALLLGLMMVAAACSGNDDAEDTQDNQEVDEAAPIESEETESPVEEEQRLVADTPAPRQSEPLPGFLVWVHDQEPPDLHVDDPINNLGVTRWIREAMLESLFGVDSTTSYYPELLAGEPTVTVNDDDTVVIDYRLRDGLSWSDGAPLTSADVEYTHGVITEGCQVEADGSIVDGTADGCVYLLSDRSTIPYELVTSFEVIDDLSFRVSLASFSPNWRGMYPQVYAAHAFGSDAAEVNRNLRTFIGLPASGPMIFDSWDPGDSLTMVRNDAYHGSVSPDAENRGIAAVEGVQVNFVADAEAQIDAVLAGTAQVIMTQPQPDFERLTESDDFTVAPSAGPEFEHWGLNQLNVHLAKPQVREAVAYALDKNEVIDELYRPLFGSAQPAEMLGNTYIAANQPGYEDHQVEYAGNNVTAAKAALESAGYTAGQEGVYEHPLDGRLALRVGTTGGNPFRERLQTLVQQQLAGAGIEIVIDNVPGGAYFRERPFAEAALAASASGGAEGDPTVWDITQFAWVGGPWPGGQSGSYRSGARSNPYGFANAEFDVRASECDATADDAERVACYNELDSYVTTLEKGDDGLFMIPITQKPSFFGYLSAQLDGAGIAPDSDDGGPLANVVDYRFN